MKLNVEPLDGRYLWEIKLADYDLPGMLWRYPKEAASYLKDGVAEKSQAWWDSITSEPDPQGTVAADAASVPCLFTALVTVESDEQPTVYVTRPGSAKGLLGRFVPEKVAEGVWQVEVRLPITSWASSRYNIPIYVSALTPSGDADVVEIPVRLLNARIVPKVAPDEAKRDAIAFWRAGLLAAKDRLFGMIVTEDEVRRAWEAVRRQLADAGLNLPERPPSLRELARDWEQFLLTSPDWDRAWTPVEAGLSYRHSFDSWVKWQAWLADKLAEVVLPELLKQYLAWHASRMVSADEPKATAIREFFIAFGGVPAYAAPQKQVWFSDLPEEVRKALTDVNQLSPVMYLVEEDPEHPYAWDDGKVYMVLTRKKGLLYITDEGLKEGLPREEKPQEPKPEEVARRVAEAKEQVVTSAEQELRKLLLKVTGFRVGMEELRKLAAAKVGGDAAFDVHPMIDCDRLKDILSGRGSPIEALGDEASIWSLLTGRGYPTMPQSLFKALRSEAGQLINSVWGEECMRRWKEECTKALDEVRRKIRGERLDCDRAKALSSILAGCRQLNYIYRWDPITGALIPTLSIGVWLWGVLRGMRWLGIPRETYRDDLMSAELALDDFLYRACMEVQGRRMSIEEVAAALDRGLEAWRNTGEMPEEAVAMAKEILASEDLSRFPALESRAKLVLAAIGSPVIDSELLKEEGNWRITSVMRDTDLYELAKRVNEVLKERYADSGLAGEIDTEAITEATRYIFGSAILGMRKDWEAVMRGEMPEAEWNSKWAPYLAGDLDRMAEDIAGAIDLSWSVSPLDLYYTIKAGASRKFEELYADALSPEKLVREKLITVESVDPLEARSYLLALQDMFLRNLSKAISKHLSAWRPRRFESWDGLKSSLEELVNAILDDTTQETLRQFRQKYPDPKWDVNRLLALLESYLNGWLVIPGPGLGHTEQRLWLRFGLAGAGGLFILLKGLMGG